MMCGTKATTELDLEEESCGVSHHAHHFRANPGGRYVAFAVVSETTLLSYEMHASVQPDALHASRRGFVEQSTGCVQ